MTKRDKAKRLALIRRVHRRMKKRAADLAEPEAPDTEPVELVDDLPDEV